MVFKLLAIVTVCTVHGYCKIMRRDKIKQKAPKLMPKRTLVPYENLLFNWGRVCDAHLAVGIGSSSLSSFSRSTASPASVRCFPSELVLQVDLRLFGASALHRATNSL